MLSVSARGPEWGRLWHGRCCDFVLMPDFYDSNIGPLLISPNAKTGTMLYEVNDVVADILKGDVKWQICKSKSLHSTR